MKRICVALTVFVLLYGAGENWTRLYPSGTPPSPRWGAASVYDAGADRFIVFGGAIWGTAYNNLYALDGTATGNGNWSLLSPSGSVPSVRGFCAPVYDAPRQRMIIFGGYNMVGSCFNQVYFLDSICAATPHWSYASVGGTPPTVRQSSAAAYDPIQERVIYFSGWCGFSWKNDVYVLEDLDSNPTWRRLYPTGGGPGGRWGATCVYDHIDDRLFVFGGMNTSQSYTNDTWMLEGLQTGDGNWVLLSPGGQIPSGRMWTMSAYDNSCDRMLLFGGGYFQSTALGDLRSLDPLSSSPTWSLLSPTGSVPSARLGSAYALDEQRDRFIIFGGNYYNTNYNDVYVLTWDTGVFEENPTPIDRLTISVEPNPFHVSAAINLHGTPRSVESMSMYDSQGRLIKRFSTIDKNVPIRITWDGTDERGQDVPAGTYFIVIESHEGRMFEQLVKIK